MRMTAIKIDMVSDIACQWCVIGLRGLEIALDRLDGSVDATIAFHPFELNPDMPPQGENGADHVARKYGASAAQAAASRTAMRKRAEALGFARNTGLHGRIHNSFDAQRLLHWAGEIRDARAMKHPLFEGYFTDGRDIYNPEVLVDISGKAGFGRAEAQARRRCWQATVLPLTSGAGSDIGAARGSPPCPRSSSRTDM